MKRRTLSQPSKRRQPAARSAAQSAQGSSVIPNQKIIPGRTVIEVTAGQLAGLRGIVLGTSAQRWSIQLDVAAPGVLLSIDPKWVRIVAASSA